MIPLEYMSPEQLVGRNVDGRTDVYSLGATLHEMLTLQPAFRGTDRLDLIQKVARDEVPRPCSIDRRIPRDLDTICLKCLQKAPGKRYA